MNVRERMTKELTDICMTPRSWDAVSKDLVDFILNDRVRILSEIEKVIKGVIKEAYTGDQGEYCYVHEINTVLEIIDRIKGEA